MILLSHGGCRAFTYIILSLIHIRGQARGGLAGVGDCSRELGAYSAKQGGQLGRGFHEQVGVPRRCEGLLVLVRHRVGGCCERAPGWELHQQSPFEGGEKRDELRKMKATRN